MAVRSQIILLSIAVIAHYWIISTADVNVCTLQNNRREKLNASCDFESPVCTARFTTPMSEFWTLKRGSVGNSTTGRINGGHSRVSSGSYYLFNAANGHPRGDQKTDQLLLPPIPYSNICLRFWYNLPSAMSNLKVMATGRNIFNQTYKITHGWVQKSVPITGSVPLQILFESTKSGAFGYVGIDDVLVEIERRAVSSTKRSTSANRSSKHTSTTRATSSSRKSATTTLNLAITTSSFKSTQTVKNTTSMASNFTYSSLHTTKHTNRNTAIATRKSTTSNTKSSTSAITRRTTPMKTVSTTTPLSVTTVRKAVSRIVPLSTTAHKTTVSTATTKPPTSINAMTAVTNSPITTTLTIKPNTTYSSTLPTKFTFGRLSNISISNTLTTSPSSARKFSTAIRTGIATVTYTMNTAIKSSFEITPTTRTTPTYKSMTPKPTSLFDTSIINIRKTDSLTSIRNPISTTSNAKSRTSPTNRRTTLMKPVSTTKPLSATTAKKTVSANVPLYMTTHKPTVPTTTTKTPPFSSVMTSATKLPFKSTPTIKSSTNYSSTPPIIFTYYRLSSIYTSTTLTTSPTSSKNLSTSISTRQNTFTYDMTTAKKPSFKTTSNTKPTSINKTITPKFTSLLDTTITDIRHTDPVTNIRTPKSSTSNTTSITPVSTQSTTPRKLLSTTAQLSETISRKTASSTIPLSVITARRTVSTTINLSTTAHRIISTTTAKAPSFISTTIAATMPPFKTTPITTTTTTYESKPPVKFTFERLSTMSTSTSLATSPSSLRIFSTSIPTRKPEFTYAMTTATKSSFKTSPTTNPTMTQVSAVSRPINWVHTSVSTTDKTDHETKMFTPKTRNINILSSTSSSNPWTNPVAIISRITPTLATSTKKTTSKTIPLSASVHRTTVLTNPIFLAISNTILQSTKPSSGTNTVTFLSKTVLTMHTTTRPIVSSDPHAIVSTTASAPATTVSTSISKIIPSSVTTNRTIILTDKHTSWPTRKFISSTKPLLGTVSIQLVSATVSKSKNAPDTTVSAILSTAAHTQRLSVEIIAPISGIIPQRSVSTTTPKLAFTPKSSRSTLATSSSFFTTTSMKTSTHTKVNSFKSRLSSAVQTDPSFTESKHMSVTTSARSYHNIRTSTVTKPDSMTHAESMSGSASEILKATTSNSETMKTTITSQPTNNTQTNVQFNSFTVKEVRSPLTKSVLFNSTRSGNMGHMDKQKSSSDESNANEIVIIAVLCSLAGLLFLAILLLLLLRSKNGRKPFTFIANKVNVNLFKDPSEGSETALIQLRQMKNWTD